MNRIRLIFLSSLISAMAIGQYEALADDPLDEDADKAAFKESRAEYEKAAIPSDLTLLRDWSCENVFPRKQEEGIERQRLRFVRQENEIRMIMIWRDSEGRTQFENHGPITKNDKAWSGMTEMGPGGEVLSAVLIRENPGKKTLLVEFAGSERFGGGMGFNKNFRSIGNPDLWVTHYASCSVELMSLRLQRVAGAWGAGLKRH